MKDKLGRKVMTEFASQGSVTYHYLSDDNDESKKPKATEKGCHKIKP